MEEARGGRRAGPGAPPAAAGGGGPPEAKPPRGAGARDADLFRRAKTGDQRAAGALYTKYMPKMLAEAKHMMRGDVAAAEDLAHDAFLKAIQKCDQIDPAWESALGWLLRLTHNLGLDRIDERKTRRRLEREAGGNPDGGEPPVGHAALEPADDQLARKQVREAIERLPEELRTVLLMQYDGHTRDEIAAATGLRPGTVASRIKRAEKKLVAWARGEDEDQGDSEDESEGEEGS